MAKPNKDFLAEARDRFRIAAEAENWQRERSLEWWRFRAGEQWPDAIRRMREEEGRPCLTVNRADPLIHQVANEHRQNRPSVKFSPVSDGADEDKANERQGLYRHIEVNSHADVARDTAFEAMLTGGLGYYRILTKVVHPDSNEQEIFISRIRDPFCVYFDPNAQEYDLSDARWCFITEDVSESEYKRRYPKSELGSWSDWSATGNSTADWIKERSCRIAEYLYIDDDERVKWALINSVETLDEQDVPGKYIPVVPVLGDELVVDGRRQLHGLITNVIDAQRDLNYQTSALAEAVGMVPKAPYLMTPKQLGNHQAAWSQINKANKPYALFEPDPMNPGPPSRNIAEPAIQAMALLRAQAIDNFKACSGIYDASLGAQGNETSGKAIQARQVEGDTANFHFIDNMTRAIQLEAKIVTAMWGEVYDTERVIHIVKPDSTTEALVISQDFSGEDPETGRKYLNITEGEYDTVVSVQASYQTRRQQARAEMADLFRTLPPEMVARSAYMYVKSMDWDGADELSELLMPPDIRAQKKTNEAPLPPEVQQQLQLIPQMTQKLHDLSGAIENKKIEENGKFEREMAKLNMQYRIELLHQETALRVAETNANAELATIGIEARIRQIEQMLGQRHEAAMQAHSQAHETGLAAMDHIHSSAQADQSHAHGLEAQQSMMDQEPQEVASE